MNVRRSKPFRNGTSLAVILPADWVRGNKVEPGDEVELAYDEIVRTKPVRKVTASDTGGTIPDVPAAQPAKPASTDDGGIVSDPG
jgi:antitoxin component of MazEF toxin-antitoxin module